MAKLSQLLMLESMLNTYDNMNIKDAWIVEKQGESVEEMVDVIIAIRTVVNTMRGLAAGPLIS